jgi:aquaporin Z
MNEVSSTPAGTAKGGKEGTTTREHPEAAAPGRGGRRSRYPWPHLAAEFGGTAILVAVGLSVVILDFGAGSPVAALLPGEGARRLLTGFLFGCTGGLIAISPLGKISGAHINPAVTWAFWLTAKLRGSHAAGYVAAQIAGGAAGALPLLMWRGMGASVRFGATTPGPGFAPWAALLGEIGATFTMVYLLFFFVGHRRIRRFTPLLFPFLYAALVFLEAGVSGTSTNPARSLGPALISGVWRGFWVYCAGPILGALIAAGLHSRGWLGLLEIEVAKLYHFEHDPHRVFHWKGSAARTDARPDSP